MYPLFAVIHTSLTLIQNTSTSSKMMHGEFSPLPSRFAELKQQIAASIPDFEQRATNAWSGLLKELKVTTDEIATKQTEVRSSPSRIISALSCLRCASQIVPQVQFKDLQGLDEDVLQNICRRGCVVIRKVVDEAEAQSWKKDLDALVTENPVIGMPEDKKQFFML